MTADLSLTPMTDADYLTRANAVLASVEAAVDAWLDADLVDIDANRSGGLLEMSFPNRSGAWRDTRDGRDLFEALSACASEQAGQPLRFTPPA